MNLPLERSAGNKGNLPKIVTFPWKNWLLRVITRIFLWNSKITLRNIGNSGNNYDIPLEY